MYREDVKAYSLVGAITTTRIVSETLVGSCSEGVMESTYLRNFGYFFCQLRPYLSVDIIIVSFAIIL